MTRNAIIMAAGMSSRFAPLSLETPKALLNVKDEIMIERQIRQLREAGIDEIIIVVGYLKEKFEYLKEKYQVILVENPYYKKMNNFSTLYVAKEYLRNTWICSADNYFTENVFTEQSENAFYSSEYAEGTTDEWSITTDKEGKIVSVQIGGANTWVMKGHVFFNEKFSAQLITYLEEAFQKEELWDEYWENLYMAHMDEMEMYIRKYDAGIIEEFDSIDELREFDAKYKECTGSKVLQEISEKLNRPEGKMIQMKPVKFNGEVTGFEFLCDGEKYEYSYTTGLKAR